MRRDAHAWVNCNNLSWAKSNYSNVQKNVTIFSKAAWQHPLAANWIRQNRRIGSLAVWIHHHHSPTTTTLTWDMTKERRRRTRTKVHNTAFCYYENWTESKWRQITFFWLIHLINLRTRYGAVRFRDVDLTRHNSSTPAPLCHDSKPFLTITASNDLVKAGAGWRGLLSCPPPSFPLPSFLCAALQIINCIMVEKNWPD